MKKSRYVHLFEEDGRVIAFHSVALESWILNLEEKRALLYPSGADPIIINDLLASGLLVNRDEQCGKAIERLTEARKKRLKERNGRFATLRIALTEKCNMACTYCFQQAMYPEAQPRMSREEFEQQITWFVDQAGGGHVTVQYFGGEPIMEWGLLTRGDEMLREAQESGRISSFRQTMTTNGTLLTKNRARWLYEHEFDLIFSFDGPPEINNQLRVFKNSRGSYDQAARGLRIWTDTGGDGAILMTATDTNIRHLGKYVKWFLEESGLDIGTIALNSPQPTDDGWETGGKILADSVFEMWQECQSRGIDFHGPGTFIPIHLRDRVPQSDHCVDGDLHGDGGGSWPIYVNADGERSLCLVHHNDHRVVTSAEEANKNGREWHLGAPSIEDCDGCIASQMCGGPCTLERLLWGNNLSEDRCEFMRTMTKNVLTSGH